MAPRTRSGRSFNTRRSDSNDLKSQILELPDEIYLEIASHVPAIPVPTDYNDKSVNTEARLARHATFASLCQTCRTLRRIFLGYLWERIEVVEGMRTESGGSLDTLRTWEAEAGRNAATRIRHDAKAKKFATELIRQLEIVTVRDPTLAQHVRIVNVVITDYSDMHVLQELARCLSLFTNMHTLQISFLPLLSSYNRLLDTAFIPLAFKNRIYPHIQDLHLFSIAPSSPMILQACPNIRHLSWHMSDNPNLYRALRPLSYSLDMLPKLETFETLVMNHDMASFMRDYLPNLRAIILDFRTFMRSPYLVTNLQPLSELQYLHTITIKVRYREEVTTGSLPGWVTWGWQIFSAQKSSLNIKKSVVLIHGDNIRETYVISGDKVPAKLL